MVLSFLRLGSGGVYYLIHALYSIYSIALGQNKGVDSSKNPVSTINHTISPLTWS